MILIVLYILIDVRVYYMELVFCDPEGEYKFPVGERSDRKPAPYVVPVFLG